jgi:GH24 family phage-related lysozyme (muramidase)
MTGKALVVTDEHLRVQLADMRATLRHIETNQNELTRQLPDMLQRLVRLEEGTKSLSRLPADVADNKITNAVQSAIRQQHEETAGEHPQDHIRRCRCGWDRGGLGCRVRFMDCRRRVMKLSPQGLYFLAAHEGIVPAPYLDSVGVWTYGIGHAETSGLPPNPRRMQRGMPPDLDAELVRVFEVFAEDMEKFSADVNRAVTVPMEQHEFDAAVSFHFNTGAIGRATWVRSPQRPAQPQVPPSAVNAPPRERGGFFAVLMAALASLFTRKPAKPQKLGPQGFVPVPHEGRTIWVMPDFYKRDGIRMPVTGR